MNFSQKRLQDYLEGQPPEAFLILKSENIFWLSGFKGSFGMFLFFKNGESFLITDGRYAEKAQRLCEQSEMNFVLFDDGFKKSFSEKQKGLWGIEKSISLEKLDSMKALFPAVKFEPQKQVLEALRRVKTNSEILKIKKAQDLVDLVLVDFLKEKLRTGITEKALAFALEHRLRGGGNYELSFEAIVAFGENSAVPHHAPGERKLKKGDNILIDCGVKYKGFCSDMTRNFVFEGALDEYIAAYKLLKSVQAKTLSLYKSGENVKKIENSCREMLEKEALFFTHSLGHGVGLEIHELPNVSKKVDFVLQAGEIVTCEPGIYYPGSFGIRIEDLLLVGKNEPEIFSKTTKDLLSFREDGGVTVLV